MFLFRVSGWFVFTAQGVGFVFVQKFWVCLWGRLLFPGSCRGETAGARPYASKRCRTAGALNKKRHFNFILNEKISFKMMNFRFEKCVFQHQNRQDFEICKILECSKTENLKKRKKNLRSYAFRMVCILWISASAFQRGFGCKNRRRYSRERAN